MWGAKGNFRGKFVMTLLFVLGFMSLWVATQNAQTLPSFPGAEGYGAQATGGRGGQVIHVTNLNTSGPGSLQAACETSGARIVVFDVSGVINGDVIIYYGNITIAGQTAPGAGITIAGQFQTEYEYGIDNIIVRFIRVRPGSVSGAQGDAITFSRSHNFILDHVSVSWGADETVDIYEAQDVTVQWSTIEESSLANDHNTGLINGPDGNRLSLHHSLFAHHVRRCPAIANGPSDVRNNVAYNVRNGFHLDNPSNNGGFNIVGNYYKLGPSTSPIFPFHLDDDNGLDTKAYIQDSYIDAPPAFTGVINDPWAEYGNYEGLSYYFPNNGVKSNTPFSVPAVSTHSSTQAYNLVLQQAGCFPRDVVTTRTINEVNTRTGSWGAHIPSNLMQGLTPGTAPADTDHDGMPDTWETAHGLNKNADDHNTVMPSGYTAIEDYINEVAQSLIPGSGPMPPTVSITSPSNGSTYDAPASMNITANAIAQESGATISKVEFYQGSTKLGEDITSPYTYSWTGVGAGNYNLTAKAIDSNNQSATSSGVQISVNTPGCVTSTASNLYNQTFTSQTGTFTVQADATPLAVGGVLGDTGVGVNQSPPLNETGSFQTAATVRFNTANNYIEARSGSTYPATTIAWTAGNSYRIRLVVNITAHTYNAYVTALPSGTEQTIGTNLTFRSNYTAATFLNNFRAPVDGGGLQVCNLILPGTDTTAPSVTVTTPTAGTTVSGTITLTATASDNVGVTGVQFLVDGGTVGTEVSSPPYTISYNTSGLSSGNHSITARAKDAANNSTVSAAVVVAVGGSTQQNGPYIYWRNYSTGEDVVWIMDRTNYSDYSWIYKLEDVQWKIKAAADFNGDNKPDLVWRNGSTGQDVVWYMDGANYVDASWLPQVTDTSWDIGGVADFNADNKADLLWRNNSTGEDVVWIMNGTTLTTSNGLPQVADTNWKIGGTADFNADNKVDIIWRNESTGQNIVWLMNGVSYTDNVWLPTIADVNWKIEGATDVDGDNKTDILWRNSSDGQNIVWLLDGTNYSSYANLPAIADTNWHIEAVASRSSVVFSKSQ